MIKVDHQYAPAVRFDVEEARPIIQHSNALEEERMAILTKFDHHAGQATNVVLDRPHSTLSA
jgi:hypothetical protein